MPSLSLDWCLWEEGSILQWRDDCLFDSSGLQTIALKIHLFLLFWGTWRGVFLQFTLFRGFHWGLCIGLISRPLMWPLLVLQHLQSWSLCSEPPHSSCLRQGWTPALPAPIHPSQGCGFEHSGFGIGLLQGSQLLVCYQPAPAVIPADSQHSMAAHGTAKATLSPVKPVVLPLHLWWQLPAWLLGISVYRNVPAELPAVPSIPLWQGRENPTSQLGCPPVQPSHFKGLKSGGDFNLRFPSLRFFFAWRQKC